MTKALELKHVNKVFGPGTVNENRVINDISLSLDSGDFVTVIGSNGAGKSTLLNLIAGTIPVSSGQILVNGQDVTGKPAYQRAKYISRVFQDTQLGTARNLTIEENLAIAKKRGESRGMKWAKNARQRAEFQDYLKPLGLGLENRLDVEAGMLSGGQRQVLTLVMAAIKTPKLLLLDEHTAALDPRTSAQVLDLTNKIVSENKLTTLMITHDMNQALEYGNRLLMLHGGRIVLDLNAQEKEKLTVDDLVNLFQEKVGQEFSDDAMLLKN